MATKNKKLLTITRTTAYSTLSKSAMCLNITQCYRLQGTWKINRRALSKLASQSSKKPTSNQIKKHIDSATWCKVLLRVNSTNNLMNSRARHSLCRTTTSRKFRSHKKQYKTHLTSSLNEATHLLINEKATLWVKLINHTLLTNRYLFSRNVNNLNHQI